MVMLTIGRLIDWLDTGQVLSKLSRRARALYADSFAVVWRYPISGTSFSRAQVWVGPGTTLPWQSTLSLTPHRHFALSLTHSSHVAGTCRAHLNRRW